MSSTTNATCAPEQDAYMPDFRFAMVGVFGSTLSVIGLGNNALVFYLFATRAHFRESNLFYMLCLCVCDMAVSINYVVLLSLPTVADYFAIGRLHLFWHHILRPFFASTHLAISASSVLMTMATLERFVMIVTDFHTVQRVMRSNRRVIAVLAIAFGMFSRCTVFWEVKVVWFPASCPSFRRAQPLPGDSIFEAWGLPAEYERYWRFWYRNIATILMPFIVMAVCNAMIVRSLRRQTRRDTRKRFHGMHILDTAVANYLLKQIMRLVPDSMAEQIEQAQLNHQRMKEEERLTAQLTRASVRAATRMLVLVVACYLVANALNVIVTTIEFWDQNLLYSSQEWIAFYAIGTDLVNLFTVFACAVRLPIYVLCNGQVREDLRHMLGMTTGDAHSDEALRRRNALRRRSDGTMLIAFDRGDKQRRSWARRLYERQVVVNQHRHSDRSSPILTSSHLASTTRTISPLPQLLTSARYRRYTIEVEGSTYYVNRQTPTRPRCAEAEDHRLVLTVPLDVGLVSQL